MHFRLHSQFGRAGYAGWCKCSKCNVVMNAMLLASKWQTFTNRIFPSLHDANRIAFGCFILWWNRCPLSATRKRIRNVMTVVDQANLAETINASSEIQSHRHIESNESCWPTSGSHQWQCITYECILCRQMREHTNIGRTHNCAMQFILQILPYKFEWILNAPVLMRKQAWCNHKSWMETANDDPTAWFRLQHWGIQAETHH